MKQTILFALLLSVVYLASAEVYAKDVRICMPPVASFTQNVRTVSTSDNIAKRIKVQYDTFIKKQRMDTYSLDGNLVASQLISIDSSNNTLVYLIIGDSCMCFNDGKTGMDAVFSQCITEPVLEKDSIAELPALKVGTCLVSDNVDENIYWVTPAKEGGYCWLLSRVEYGSSNAVLTDTLFTGHSLQVDANALKVPSNCPKVCQPKKFFKTEFF